MSIYQTTEKSLDDLVASYTLHCN